MAYHKNSDPVSLHDCHFWVDSVESSLTHPAVKSFERVRPSAIHRSEPCNSFDNMPHQVKSDDLIMKESEGSCHYKNLLRKWLMAGSKIVHCPQ